MYHQIRTGVIGVGSMGQNHARVYNEISDLIAVADPNEEQGREVASRLGVEWYSDYREMLQNIDAVTVAVPTFLHLEVARDVADAGVHMLIEKPLSHSSADAQEIVDIAHKKEVILAVGHIERHNPVISFAKKGLKDGKWGNLITLSSKRVSNYPHRIKDVGVVFDLAIHDLDIISYLTDSQVVSLQAHGGSITNEGNVDHVSIIMDFQNGSNGIIEANWLTPMKVRELTLTCSKAYVILDYMDQSVSIKRLDSLELEEQNLWDAKYEIVEDKPTIKKYEPLKNELMDFLGCIEKSCEPMVTGAHGVRSVKLAEWANKCINIK